MPRNTSLALGALAALGIAATVSTLAVAQSMYMKSMTDNWGAQNTVGKLDDNEGIYVDMKGFSIKKGAAKGDPAALIKKSAAREVSDGAIIFRSGDKLFIVDGRPPTTTN